VADGRQPRVPVGRHRLVKGPRYSGSHVAPAGARCCRTTGCKTKRYHPLEALSFKTDGNSSAVGRAGRYSNGAAANLCPMSDNGGPTRTSGDVRYRTALGGKADIRKASG
jgi:hypothetical protein